MWVLQKKGSDVPRDVIVSTMSNKKCRSKTKYPTGIIKDSMICARGRGKDGCYVSIDSK